MPKKHTFSPETLARLAAGQDAASIGDIPAAAKHLVDALAKAPAADKAAWLKRIAEFEGK